MRKDCKSHTIYSGENGHFDVAVSSLSSLVSEFVRSCAQILIGLSWTTGMKSYLNVNYYYAEVAGYFLLLLFFLQR